MTLTLDRLAIEEAGANPKRLAAAIHAQLNLTSGSVPVEAIAYALDIIEIRVELLTHFEGALITTPERGSGSILVNANANTRRQRFTIAHELGHFLSPWHKPGSPIGFACGQADLRAQDRSAQDRHRRQEAEANAFAIELLAPRQQLKRHLVGLPDLNRVEAIVQAFDISREAAVRRYVALHSEASAVVFTRDRRVIYSERGRDFPPLALQGGQIVPEIVTHFRLIGPSDIVPVDAEDWLIRPNGLELTAQILVQDDGRSTILLHAQSIEDEDDDPAIEDAYARFTKFSRR
jgi:hypothetical protein